MNELNVKELNELEVSAKKLAELLTTMDEVGQKCVLSFIHGMATGESLAKTSA